MAFTHGKAAVVYQDGNDLTGYLRSFTGAAEVDTAESTTFANDDKTYVAGLRDATISAEGLFDATFDGDVNTITGNGTKSVWSYYPAGDAVGAAGRGYSLDITSAERSADVGDVVMLSVEGQSSTGSEQVISHYALAQAAASGTATVYDGTAQSTAGGAGYLHATAISGTVIVTLEDSADNVTYGSLQVLGTITATGGWRTAITGTVERYTRVTYDCTNGTATFQAGFHRA